MRRFTITALALELLLATASFAQSGAIIPEHGAGHVDRPSCVLLKRMGPADQVTSRLYSFGIRGKQFQYIEGKLPEGFPFHGRLTDHDVRNLQARGAEVMVLNQNYSPEDLKQARADCQGVTGKTPLQEGEKADPALAQTAVANSSATTKWTATTAAATPATAATAAKTTAADDLTISSVPSGADIEIDGKFVGNTPSSVTLAPGEHEIVVKKNGFAVWNRKITVSGGHINVNAELAQNSK